MPDIMSTSVSALLAFRRALDVTGHNIANVNTPGYSRQRAELVTRGAQGFDNGFIGRGTEVSTVRRLYDDLLALQVRNTASSYRQLDVFASHASRVNDLFASTETGLSASLQSFINAAQNVANTPTSIPARQVFLSEAESLRDRLRYYDSRLRDMDAEVNALLDAEMAEVTSIARGIANLNGEIALAFTTHGQPPNDLLDQRDLLLDRLAEHIGINAVPAGDGTISVFIGNGQPLVLGNTAAELITQADPFDPSRRIVAMRAGGTVTDINGLITGGRIGGLLDFRSDMLDPARNALGRMSIALTEVVNGQHRAGLDLNGAMGKDLFSVGGVETLAHHANSGGATLSVTRTDVGSLTEHDYILRNTGSGWELLRADTGAIVPMTGSGTGADPFRAESLEITLSGAGVAGDQFLIRPTRQAVSGLQVLISNPEQIAAAAPIRAAAHATNTGTGQISPGVAVDPTNPQLQSPVTIEFLTPTTYSINGSGTYTYTPGEPIEVNGWRVEITGGPAAGDRFTVSGNTNGAGDNRNALLLADVLSQPVLNGGTVSLDAAVGRFIGDIGVTTRQAQVNRDVQEVVHSDNVAARDSVSGVNLDEEAANLLKYQQAYQAAAQLIQVAGTLFDTLLAAASRK